MTSHRKKELTKNIFLKLVLKLIFETGFETGFEIWNWFWSRFWNKFWNWMDFETGRAVLLVERQRGKLGVKGSQEKKMEDVSHRKTMPLAAGKNHSLPPPLIYLLHPGVSYCGCLTVHHLVLPSRTFKCYMCLHIFVSDIQPEKFVDYCDTHFLIFSINY